MIIQIKSKSEIEGFKEVGSITGKILQTILKEIKPGVTTLFLDEVARESCKKYNVTPTFLNYNGFPASICTSINNILVHGIPSDYILRATDTITIDFGATMDGFIGDTAETVSVDPQAPLTDALYNPAIIINSCKDCLSSIIPLCRPLNLLSQICNSIFDLAKLNHFSVPLFYGGHGINRFTLHAYPFIPCHSVNLQDVTLRPGMILALEPMFINGTGKTTILEDNWTVQSDGPSAHFEHTILVTEGDPIILTQYHDFIKQEAP
jgi:methionyl aminopeptidase